MIALSSPGVASILVFKSCSSNSLHICLMIQMTKLNEAIEKVAKQIKTEINHIEADRKKSIKAILTEISVQYFKVTPLMIYFSNHKL